MDNIRTSLSQFNKTSHRAILQYISVLIIVEAGLIHHYFLT